VLTKGMPVTILDGTVIDEMERVAVETAEGIRGFAAAEYLSDIRSGSVLTEGVDYRAEYSNNDGAGTATVTVEGLGSYRGSDSASFTIHHFRDVSTADWFFDPVRQAVQTGLMNGTTATSFEPNTETNRAMFATILYRMAGKPAVEDAKYNDVKKNDWFADAVDWVTYAKIDLGYASGNFAPMDTLTRAQMVTMLYRYTLHQGYAAPVDRSAGMQYPDWDKVPESAQDAICWAVKAGLINGIDGNLSPRTGATRAQICTVMQRYRLLLETGVTTTQGEAPSIAGD